MLQVEKKAIHAGYHKRAIFNQTKPRVHISRPDLQTCLQTKWTDRTSIPKEHQTFTYLLKELNYSSMKISPVSSSAFIPRVVAN